MEFGSFFFKTSGLRKRRGKVVVQWYTMSYFCSLDFRGVCVLPRLLVLSPFRAAKEHEQPHSGHLNAEIVEMTGGPKLWRSLSSCEGPSLRMPSVSLGLDGFKTPSAFRLLFS